MRSDKASVPLTLVVLQPTSFCNLDCSYCYVPGRRDAAKMSETVLDAVFSKTLGAPIAQFRRFEFLWHAGEPLTAGLEFFENALESMRKHLPPGAKPVNAVQTNGSLINTEWATFFRRNGFKVGVSIDGPAFLHDKYRRNWAGKGSLKQALRGFHLLQDQGVEPAALAVLTRESLDHPDEIFSFFLENDIWSFGFNIEEVENQNSSSSLGVHHADPPTWLRKKYRQFFSRLFDLWWPLRHYVSIREIQDLAHGIERKLADPSYQRQPDESTPLGIVTIAKNGDITTFSPEFAGAEAPEFDDFVVGNILEISSLTDILDSSVFHRMEAQAAAGRQECAKSCLYFDLCGSAFLSNRYFETGRFDGAESTSCILQRQIAARTVLDKLTDASTLSTL